MKPWTFALLLALTPALTGCGDKGLPPATETPQADHAAIQKGIEYQMKMGGHRMPKKK